jgi:SpoU rRNA methylase family enzyme
MHKHPYLRGYEVVVVAVLKNALRTEEPEYLTTEEAVRAAGGVGPDDRIEVAAILPKEGLSFVTSDPKAMDLKAWEHLRHDVRHGAGSKRRGKK